MTKRWNEIKRVLKTPITKKRKGQQLIDLPRELQGPANNRFGGHRAQSLRGFKGNTYGAAGPVKQYTEEEIREYERKVQEQAST